MNRSPAITLPRTATRLLAVLLPLLALEMAHLAPNAISGAQGASIRAALAALAAVATGAGFLAMTVHGLRARHLATLLDATALGILAGAFSLAAVRATGMSGIAIGLAVGSLLLAARPATAALTLEPRRGYGVALIWLLVAIEGTLGVILVAAPTVAVAGFSAVLFAAAAALLGMAAVMAGRAGEGETYLLGLMIAASGATAMAIAGPYPAEPLVGMAALSLAAVLLGSTRALAAGWGATASGAAVDASVVDLEPYPTPAADPSEFTETARLVRALRSTIDELAAARRTVESQRSEIGRAARLDLITGLTNRTAILERLRTEAAEARRYAHPLAVLVLDLDGFDDLNQRLGLDGGDEILREVALRLRLRMREADALGRIGDDAFLAILPHTDEAGAAALAQAFRDRLTERPVELDREKVVLAVSIGIALVRPGMELGHAELLNAAAEALASAKAAGGNRIAFESAPRSGEAGRATQR